MNTHVIDCPEAMVSAIRHFGVIPFFKCGVQGWSIEELTDPSFWFFSSDELGPWDWKIDAVREGDIAYGKFLGSKAAFATVEYYKHLMNWRRSIPRYRMALGERFAVKTHGDRLMKYLSPNALEAIKEAGALESHELRLICSSRLTPYQIRMLGAKYKPLLTPTVKKNVMDSVYQFLEMGTWVVVGDFRREFRGPNLEYSGWQKSSLTTPDALFGSIHTEEDAPFWARRFEEEQPSSLEVSCSPEESRQFLIDHIRALFPDADEKLLLKMF